ncbi:hypothetical protein SGCZBJ_05995 [Caulobacter zeae]|uniref:T6SS Transcription factor RovC-like DNA binding domain-containing protein n=1 Tax=Caulobacter zeae TaxID=2055137 RepID=A0A2N5DPE5_9CAUL|nr:hypothetical protein SGCZBJ_05995 [Caulobacter zeae]
MAAVRGLLALRDTGRLPAPVEDGVARTGRWLRALRALDARRAGASQRQIAGVIFGEDRVAEDWNGPVRLHAHAGPATGAVGRAPGVRRLPRRLWPAPAARVGPTDGGDLALEPLRAGEPPPQVCGWFSPRLRGGPRCAGWPHRSCRTPARLDG